MELSMKQAQHQTLAPRMELSVRILQMDSLQLTEYIKEMMMENPVLDMEPPKQSGEELALKKLQWLEDQARRERENTGYYQDDEDENLLEKTVPAVTEENLTDHLLLQADLWGGDQALLPVIRHVVCCVDGNGYLDATEEELCRETGCPPETVREAVAAVQRFDPLGVCARSLSECLTLQLDPADTLGRKLAEECLEDIAKNSRRAALAKRYEVPAQAIDEAIARIRRLNPKPGSAYGGSRAPQYIRPDIVVTSFEDRYNVMLCEFTYPEIHLNQGYLQMAKESDDQEVVSYINNKVNQINWIKKCIDSRNETLLAVAKAIVKRQERFFRYGPRYLNILRMRDIAEMIDLHESTVSRAVRDKYLQCANGVYPLRYFFVKGVEGEENSASSESVKWELQRLIGDENHEKPLSDRQLADLLTAGGIEISRRTVAKYREELGIPKSTERAHRHN